MEMIVSFPGGLKVDASYKGFTIHTDQPVKDGGEGTAPSPFDLFLASLATCAGVYLLRFLQTRNLSTQNAGVRMTTVRDPETGMITHITLDLILPSDFPEKYREALLRAVDRCSVKRHLNAPPAIEVVMSRHDAPGSGPNPGL